MELSMKTITATELARNLKDVLDQVEFRGEELAIVRNNHEIARIVPGSARRSALEAMADLYRTLPSDAAENWVKDSRAHGLADKIRDPRVS
jgi:prevent-host-death family protein